MISAPIIYEDKIYGVINAYTKTDYNFFEHEKILLNSIAIRCATSMYNADLNKKNDDLQDRLLSARPGMLALSFVHDITHYIHYLNSDIDLLDDFVPKNIKNYSALDKVIESIVSNTESLSNSFGSLIRIGTGKKIKKHSTSIKSVVEDCQHLFERRFINNNINFSYEIEDGDIEFMGYSHLIEQLFVNLIFNSIVALTETTHRTKVIQTKVDTVIRKGGKWLKIEFYDNGIGIKQKDIKRIYDMDFSTKEKGNGLGLSISKRIVEDHSGEINVRSEFGVETSFSIFLPIND